MHPTHTHKRLRQTTWRYKLEVDKDSDATVAARVIKTYEGLEELYGILALVSRVGNCDAWLYLCLILTRHCLALISGVSHFAIFCVFSWANVVLPGERNNLGD